MTDWDAVVLDLDGEEEMLRACISSLLDQSIAPRRIVVFDNGSAVPTSSRLGELTARVEHVRVDQNLGFARGMNAAMSRSSSPFVALVNNDAAVDREWAKTLFELFESTRVAAVQTVITRGDSATIDGAGIALIGGRIAQLGHGEPISRLAARLFWGVSATAAIYRRSALDDVALTRSEVFDARFETYFEDVELAARLDAAGYEMLLVDAPLARHHGSASASRIGTRSEFLRTRNRYFVARLHPEVARRIALLAEDVRRIGRSISRFEFRKTAVITRGVLAGLLSRLEP